MPHKEKQILKKYPFLPQSSEILSRINQILPIFFSIVTNTQILS